MLLQTSDISVFEANIRFLGGFLACFALTGDVMFREKAQQIAEKLLPAFKTPTGIPHALVNMKTGVSRIILVYYLILINIMVFLFVFSLVKTLVGPVVDQVFYRNSVHFIWNSLI